MRVFDIAALLLLVSIFVCIDGKSSRSAATAGYSKSQKDNKTKKLPRSSIKRSQSSRYEDEDDDDYFQSKRSKTRRSSDSKSSSKPFSKSHRMEVVPWSNEPKGPSLRERLEGLAKQSQSIYKDVYRRAKVLRSSAFEGMLLKATWPDDEPIPQPLLDEIIKYSIPAFKYARTSSDDDPYHMTVHKLWTKMCEKDWRTIIKSLYILHVVSRESSPEICQRFSVTIRDMARERNPKRPDHRYFDTRQISEVDVTGEAFESYIVSYATFVLYRIRNFSGKFEELQSITESTSEKSVAAKLKKAQQLISFGLRAVVTEKSQRNPIIAKVTQTLANDIREVWNLFGSKLGPFVGLGEAYGGDKAAEKDVLALLKFYEDSNQQVKVFLTKANKVCEQFRYKINGVVDKAIESDKLKECILRLSGGRVPLLATGIEEQEELLERCRSDKWGSRLAGAEEDEDEDEEFDDEEEEEETGESDGSDEVSGESQVYEEEDEEEQEVEEEDDDVSGEEEVEEDEEIEDTPDSDEDGEVDGDEEEDEDVEGESAEQAAESEPEDVEESDGDSDDTDDADEEAAGDEEAEEDEGSEGESDDEEEGVEEDSEDTEDTDDEAQSDEDENDDEDDDEGDEEEDSSADEDSDGDDNGEEEENEDED